ncbi:MAG: glycosyltransferase family 2 protein [Candidatus Polarisedimenticolia bacterium]
MTDGSSTPRVSIVMPLFNRAELTRACAAALFGLEERAAFELLLVDNGSSDATPRLVRELAAADPRVRALRNAKNVGFARACNQGAAAARGRDLLFLNNDTEPLAGWLDALVAVLDDDPSVGAVGARLLYPDGTIQHAGVLIAEFPGVDPLRAVHVYARARGDAPEVLERREYQAVTAAAALVRRATFEALGGFDEEYWNGYEDIDLCFRIRERGERVVYEPRSVIVHHESQSGPERFRGVARNVRRLHERWIGKVKPDVVVAPDGTARDTGAGQVRRYRVS